MSEIVILYNRRGRLVRSDDGKFLVSDARQPTMYFVLFVRNYFTAFVVLMAHHLGSTVDGSVHSRRYRYVIASDGRSQ